MSLESRTFVQKGSTAQHWNLETSTLKVCVQHAKSHDHRAKKTEEERGKGVLVSLPTEFEEQWEAESALCEISMSKKILCKVVVILRFGLDAQALFDKLSALTPMKTIPTPKPGNPPSSPPPPACATRSPVTCNKDPYCHKEFLFIYIPSLIDCVTNRGWMQTADGLYLPQTWQAMTLCTWALFIGWWINVNYVTASFEKSQLTVYTVDGILN